MCSSLSQSKKPLSSELTHANGCTSTVYIEASLLTMTHDNDNDCNQKQKDEQHHKVLANNTSDALASNGFVSMLSNLFPCFDNDGALKLNSNAMTNDLNIRNVSSKGRNDDVANVVTIAQNHMQSL